MATQPRACIYTRTSTEEQHTANQLTELEQLARKRGFEVVHTVEETMSAMKKRPGLDDAFQRAHRGEFDVFVVWALDRLGRSMTGNLAAVLELDRLGVQVISMREPWLDTGGPVRGLLVAICSWVAEQERARIVERTKAGLARARREGRVIGRPRVSVDLDEALRLRRRGMPVASAARSMGVSTSTLNRALRMYRAEVGLNGGVKTLATDEEP